MKNNIAISINITAHNEGLLLYKTLRSVEAMCGYFSERNTDKYQVNITLDNPSAETSKIAENFKSSKFDLNVFNVKFGDLADCRNFLVEKSTGKYCAFIDGDDLFSENYLHQAYNLACSNNGNNVYSPEFLVSFGEHNYVIKKLDFNSNKFHAINSFSENYFISQSFALTEIFSSTPFRPNTDGYGMEDWDWNNTALAKGYKFYNVPDSIFFYRRKKQSMVVNQTFNKATLRPNSFFSPIIFTKFEPYNLVNKTLKNNNGRMKSSVKKLIKLSTFGSETIKVYLKDQYLANKKLININKYREDSKLATDKVGMSKKAFDEWKKINKIEPLIRPSESNLATMVIGEYSSESKQALLYYRLCKMQLESNTPYKHLVVVPHLVKGGADLTAIRLIKALSEIDKAHRVLVISTMNLKSHWAHKLKEFNNVDYANPHEMLEGLSNDEIEIILLRILQNWGVANLHIINSEVAYQLVIDYKNVIDSSIKIFLHTYAFDMDQEGFIYNYIANGLVETYSRVDRFITDSQTYKDELCDINGFDSSKVTVLKQPIEDSLVFLEKNSRTKKICWAGRISEAKLVEVAISIGKRLAGEGIELHFYGHLDHEYKINNHFENMISEHSNIHYHGSFDSFGDIPMHEYDILLFTSKNEGMANILLEAIATNSFVVASNVGATSEAIINGKNGYVVDDIASPLAYVEAIKNFYRKDQEEINKIATKINRELTAERTFEAYKEKVRKLLN